MAIYDHITMWRLSGVCVMHRKLNGMKDEVFNYAFGGKTRELLRCNNHNVF